MRAAHESCGWRREAALFRGRGTRGDPSTCFGFNTLQRTHDHEGDRRDGEKAGRHCVGPARQRQIRKVRSRLVSKSQATVDVRQDSSFFCSSICFFRNFGAVRFTFGVSMALPPCAHLARTCVQNPPDLCRVLGIHIFA